MIRWSLIAFSESLSRISGTFRLAKSVLIRYINPRHSPVLTIGYWDTLVRFFIQAKVFSAPSGSSFTTLAKVTHRELEPRNYLRAYVTFDASYKGDISLLSSASYLIKEEKATTPRIDLLASLTLRSSWESFRISSPGSSANIILEQSVARFPLSLYYCMRDTVIMEQVLAVDPEIMFRRLCLFL